MQRMRFGATWLVIAGLCLCAFTTQARMHKVDPGEVPVLEPGEGLLVMAVDTDADLQSVRLNKDGQLFGAGMMTHLSAGRSYRLFVAPAGDYTWNKVEFLSNYFVKLRDDPEFKFKVEPGRIIYPGDLLFRPKTLWRVEAAMTNRGLAAIDWLQQQHPGVYARYEFAYSGHYPDPFPAFYRAARASHPEAKPANEVVLKAPPAPGKLPIAVKTLFRQGRIREASLNPRGDLLALHVREDDKDFRIVLVDLPANTSSVLATSALPFEDIEWSGDDVLLFASDPPIDPRRVRAVRFGADPTGRRTRTVLKLPDGGSVLDPLPEEPDAILYASYGLSGELMVHKLYLFDQHSVDKVRRTYAARLNTGLKDDLGWLTDGHGNLRLAVVKRGEDQVLVRRQGDAFEDVMVLSDDGDFDPVGVSYEGDQIYAVTDKDRAQRELVAYDVATRKNVRTLFAKPGIDVQGVIFGNHREPIGVTYLEGGRLASEYFDDAGNRLARSLQAAFPGRSIAIASRNRDGKHVILWADAGGQPPQLYHLDVDKRSANLIDEDMPWLDNLHFAPTDVVRFKGGDGLPLEAFLTLPPGAGKRPLVVFPHGGPVGVADTLGFEAEVQFLASLGYAVLRVNYRGSAGYGRAFREAGQRSYGTLIEDDIDAAIREVLAKYPLDEKRMCAVGSSYGGYSAMVMAVRWPDRFRCAVSIAGVADRVLFFTASDSSRTVKGRELMERIIGDPNTQLAAMQATSPLYRYEQIRIPIMLVHGLEDRRVDEEHTRRMLRMLDMAGRTPVGLEFAKEGHGFEDPDNLDKLWSGVAGFLQTYLDHPTTAAAAPGISTATGAD
jgi:dipeptidyl aminopeptidase/acylaminoacyl peptidase